MKLVPKLWGEERWIVNSDKYCGKKLILKKGFRCSIHHHKIKDETFYIQSGRVLMEFGENAEERRIMNSGDSVRIKPSTWHRFTGLEDSEIFEFSTKHMEEDSYRKTQSGRVDLESLSSKP